jgi:hypothetical protein
MSDVIKQSGVDNRGRNKNGNVDHMHPNTRIRHLREQFGQAFAPGWDGERTLGDLLKESNVASLSQYLKQHGLREQAA